MKGGISRLNVILAEVRAERTQSTSNTQSKSNTDLVNNHEADWIDERPEEEHNFAGQEVNDADIPRSFAQYISGDWYKSRRIKEHNDLKRIMLELFISFIQCSYHTSQWGNEGDWDHAFQEDLARCLCDSNSKTVQEMDAVDLNCKCSGQFGIMKSAHLIIDFEMHPARKKLDIEFCK